LNGNKQIIQDQRKRKSATRWGVTGFAVVIDAKSEDETFQMRLRLNGRAFILARNLSKLISRRFKVNSAMKTSVLALLLGVIITASAAYGNWKQDWERTVAAAEKEGEVSIYGQSRAGVGKAILAFKDAYPKILSADRAATWPRRSWRKNGPANTLSIFLSVAAAPWCWFTIRRESCSRFRRC
jgi:hypothetical protein